METTGEGIRAQIESSTTTPYEGTLTLDRLESIVTDIYSRPITTGEAYISTNSITPVSIPNYRVYYGTRGYANAYIYEKEALPKPQASDPEAINIYKKLIQKNP